MCTCATHTRMCAATVPLGRRRNCALVRHTHMCAATVPPAGLEPSPKGRAGPKAQRLNRYTSGPRVGHMYLLMGKIMVLETGGYFCGFFLYHDGFKNYQVPGMSVKIPPPKRGGIFTDQNSQGGVFLRTTLY